MIRFSDIESLPDYQTAPEDLKLKIKSLYFDHYMAGTVPPERMDLAKRQFVFGRPSYVSPDDPNYMEQLATSGEPEVQAAMGNLTGGYQPRTPEDTTKFSNLVSSALGMMPAISQGQPPQPQQQTAESLAAQAASPIAGILEGQKNLAQQDLLRRAFEYIAGIGGKELPEKSITPKHKARAVAEHMARQEGIPFQEYREGSEVPEQYAGRLVNAFAAGLPSAATKATTGEGIVAEPTSTAGKIAGELGELSGFIAGVPGGAMGRAPRFAKEFLDIPGPIAQAVPRFIPGRGVAGAASRLLPKFGRKTGEGLAVSVTIPEKIWNTAMRGVATGAGLAAGYGVRHVGEAVQEKTVMDGVKNMVRAMEEGANTGAIFGVAGAIPQRVIRIAVGVAALEAQRTTGLKAPIFDDRPIEEKVYDIAQSVFFLWSRHGTPILENIEKRVNDYAKSPTADQPIRLIEYAAKEWQTKAVATKQQPIRMPGSQYSTPGEVVLDKPIHVGEPEKPPPFLPYTGPQPRPALPAGQGFELKGAPYTPKPVIPPKKPGPAEEAAAVFQKEFATLQGPAGRAALIDRLRQMEQEPQAAEIAFPKAEVSAEAPKPQEAPQEPQARAKEPWEMTQEGYKRERISRHDRLFKKGRYPYPYSEKTDWELRDIVSHRESVEQALSEGKPVPPEVLAEYPDLKPVKEERPQVTPEVTGEKPETKRDKALREYRGYIDSLTDEQRAQAGGLIEAEPASPGLQMRKIQKTLVEKPAEPQQLEKPIPSQPAEMGMKDWYINADDHPIWVSRKKAIDSGWRGPFSKKEVSELTGVILSARDKIGKPIPSPEYPLTAEEKRRYYPEQVEKPGPEPEISTEAPEPAGELWQMTKDEARIATMKQRAEIDIPSVSSAAKKALEGYASPQERPLVEKGWREEFGKADAEREQAIRKAVSEGKPVPAEILAEYPDLVEDIINKAAPGHGFKFEGVAPEGYAPPGYSFHSENPDSPINSASFSIPDLKPETITAKVQEKLDIFAGKETNAEKIRQIYKEELESYNILRKQAIDEGISEQDIRAAESEADALEPSPATARRPVTPPIVKTGEKVSPPAEKTAEITQASVVPEKPVAIGTAWVGNQWKPILEAEEIKRGKNKGKFRISLPQKTAAGNLKTKIVDAGAVRLAEKQEPTEAPRKPLPLPAAKAEDKTITLRGAIKKAGYINPLNLKGEAKDLPLAAKYLVRKSGIPFDDLERQLRDDGWLYPNESLFDVLRNQENLKRRRVTGETPEVAERFKTKEEQRFEEEAAKEPEKPPGKPEDYITINAEDLPEGKKLTLIEGKSPDGWDVYEVTEKDPFEITLTDGETITLKPMDKVEVLATDLPRAEKKPEPKPILTRQTQAGDSVVRLKRKKGERPKQETLTTAFETAKDKEAGGKLRLEGEKVGAKEAEAAKKIMGDAAKDGEPLDDRDTFTVMRVKDNKDNPVTFKRGEYVKAWINKDKSIEGEIDGISHANKEARVGNVWFEFGRIYKAERPEPKKPKAPTAPLSKIIEEVNLKNAPPEFSLGEKVTFKVRIGKKKWLQNEGKIVEIKPSATGTYYEVETPNRRVVGMTTTIRLPGKDISKWKSVDKGEDKPPLPQTKKQKALEEYREFIDGLSEADREKAGDLIIESPDSPGLQKRKIEKAIAEPVGSAEKPAAEKAVVPGAEAAKRKKQAAKLREVGQSTLDRANEKYNQDRLENTGRRARMAASARADAAGDIQIAETMLKIADGIEAGEFKRLANVTAKTQIEMLDRILRQARIRQLQANKLRYEDHKDDPITEKDIEFVEYPHVRIYEDMISGVRRNLAEHRGGKKLAGIVSSRPSPAEAKMILDFAKKNKIDLPWTIESDYKEVTAMNRLGLENEAQLKEALTELLNVRAGRKKEDPIKAMERELLGTKIAGFFPTPEGLADRMVEEADIIEGMDILEPSAGVGNIADGIRKAGYDTDVIEIVPTLSKVLEAKGYDIVASDFLEFDSKKYDRILMNPPFEKMQDVDHVRHAYDLLKPGGRIVAIMGDGVFFRSDKKAQDFRDWLDDIGGISEKLPSGTFKGVKQLRETGVVSRLVTIDKPGESEIGNAFLKEAKRLVGDEAGSVTIDLDLMKDAAKVLPKADPRNLWKNYVGGPAWDKGVMELLPKILEKVPGGKPLVRAFHYGYRGDLPMAEQFISSFEEMKRVYRGWQQYAIDIGNRLNSKSEKSQMVIGEAIRGEDVILSDDEKVLVDEAKEVLYTLGKRAVELDLLSEEAFFKNAGKYMPRLYTSKEFHGLLDQFGIKKPQRLDLSRFKKRKDIPKKIREQMGEILTPGYPVAKGIFQLSHDIELAKFFKTVAANPEWAVPSKKLQILPADEDSKTYGVWDGNRNMGVFNTFQEAREFKKEYMAKWSAENPVPAGWKQLPENKKLGALSGAYIHPEIYADVNETIQVLTEGDKIWRKALGVWKYGKVIISPKTHMRNLLSNSILAHLGGLPMYEQPFYLVMATDEMINGGKLYHAAIKTGLLKSTFVNAELRLLFDQVEGQLKGIKASSIPEKLGWIAKAWEGIKLAKNKAARLYEAEEQWFKMAKFIYNVENEGMDHAEAARDAERWLFDYSKVTKFQEKYRTKWYGAPFATFTFKALPRIAEAAIKTPWRFILPLAIIMALEEAARELIGDTQEETTAKAKLKKDWMKGGIKFSPNFARFPLIDEYGREYYLNLTYILPWGDIGESGGFGPIPGSLMPFSQPFVKTPIEVIFNYDKFWEQPIVKETDLAGKTLPAKIKTRAGKIGSKLVQDLAPTPVIDLNKGIAAVRGKPDYRGRERAGTSIWLDVIFGVKTYPIDYDEEINKRIEKLHPREGHIARMIVGEIRTLSVKRDAVIARGGSGDSYKKQIDEKYKQLNGLLVELEPYVEAHSKIKKPVIPRKK